MPIKIMQQKVMKQQTLPKVITKRMHRPIRLQLQRLLPLYMPTTLRPSPLLIFARQVHQLLLRFPITFLRNLPTTAFLAKLPQFILTFFAAVRPSARSSMDTVRGFLFRKVFVRRVFVFFEEELELGEVDREFLELGLVDDGVRVRKVEGDFFV